MLCIIGGRFLPQEAFDKQAFYSVMASGQLREIDRELKSVDASEIPEKGAYGGALLMKKAGLVALPKDKLKDFRLGATQLETAISKDSTNAEYRFLRLSIQEHAPRIVKYSADIQRDRAFIRLHLKSLPPVVQDAISEYSKHSHVL